MAKPKGVMFGPKTARKLLQMAQQKSMPGGSVEYPEARIMSFTFWEGVLTQPLGSPKSVYAPTTAKCKVYRCSHDVSSATEVKLTTDDMIEIDVVCYDVGVSGNIGDYIYGWNVKGEYRVVHVEGGLVAFEIIGTLNGEEPILPLNPDGSVQVDAYRLRKRLSGESVGPGAEIQDAYERVPLIDVDGEIVDDEFLIELVESGYSHQAVAFPGNVVYAMKSPSAASRWQVVTGGTQFVSGIPDQDVEPGDHVGGGKTATVVIYPGRNLFVSGGNLTEPVTYTIDISRAMTHLRAGEHTLFFYRSLFSGEPTEPETTSAAKFGWIGVQQLQVGCGLAFDETPESPDFGELSFDGGSVAGDGLSWNDELCQLNAEPVDCTTLATSIPCCADLCDRLDNIEDRLDTIEDRLDGIDAIILDLIACCEYNTACCIENRYCCEYLDARVDYCCGPGKPHDPPCGRCVWEWNDPEEEPSLIEPCGGAPETEGGICGCNPPTVFDVPGIYFTDCEETEVEMIQTTCCEEAVPSIMHVTISNLLNCACMDGATATIVNTGGFEWEGPVEGETCGPGYVIRLFCDGGGWHLSFVVNDVLGGSSDPIAEECDPFELVFNHPASGCGEDPGNEFVTVTITA